MEELEDNDNDYGYESVGIEKVKKAVKLTYSQQNFMTQG